MEELGVASLRERLLCVLVRSWQGKQSKRGTTFLQAMVEDQEGGFQVNCFLDEDSLSELREAMTYSKETGTPLIMECDMNLNDDGSQVFVNGRAAIPYDNYVENLDTSRDLVRIRLSIQENERVLDTLERTMTAAVRSLAKLKRDEESHGISIEFICGSESRFLDSRYPWKGAKQCLQLLSGVVKFSYLAGGMDNS